MKIGVFFHKVWKKRVSKSFVNLSFPCWVLGGEKEEKPDHCPLGKDFDVSARIMNTVIKIYSCELYHLFNTYLILSGREYIPWGCNTATETSVRRSVVHSWGSKQSVNTWYFLFLSISLCLKGSISFLSHIQHNFVREGRGQSVFGHLSP